jgi:CRP-like cAMP-binding protein
VTIVTYKNRNCIILCIVDNNLAHYISKFFKTFELVKFKKGETIIDIESSGNKYCYLIKKGIVRQYLLDHKGDEKTLNLFGQNQVFPIYDLFNHTSQYYYEACSNTEAWQTPEKTLCDAVKKDNFLLEAVLQRLVQRSLYNLKCLENQMLSLSTTKVLMAFYSYVIVNSKKTDNQAEIKSSITHKEIAALAGVSRETASREIYKLIDNNLLSNKNKNYTLHNLSKIEKMLQFS